MNKRKKFIAPKPQLFPDIKDWPIHKFHKDRDKFVSEICEQTFQAIRNAYGEDLFSLLAKTSYSELIRVKNYPWKVDPNDDKQFWSRLQKEIKALNSNTPEFTRALKYLKEGGSLDIIKSKYKVSKKVQDELSKL